MLKNVEVRTGGNLIFRTVFRRQRQGKTSENLKKPQIEEGDMDQREDLNWLRERVPDAGALARGKGSAVPAAGLCGTPGADAVGGLRAADEEPIPGLGLAGFRGTGDSRIGRLRLVGFRGPGSTGIAESGRPAGARVQAGLRSEKTA